MNTFEDFANTTIKASKIIKQDEAEAFLAANNVKALWEYAYRLAPLIVVYCKKRLPSQASETDYQDAVQDAMTEFPKWLEDYDSSKALFTAFIEHKIGNHIVRYLWTLVNGGTGSYDTMAEPVTYLEELEPWRDDRDETIDDNTMGIQIESDAFGTRDPLTETIAEETAINAFKYAKRVGKHVLGPWMEPELNPESQVA